LTRYSSSSDSPSLIRCIASRTRSRSSGWTPFEEVPGILAEHRGRSPPAVLVGGVDERKLRPVVAENTEDAVGGLGELPQVAGRPLAPGPRDGVLDPVCQDRLLAGPGLRLEVVRDAGGDRVARDLLRALSGEENKGDVGVPLADVPKELDAVRRGISSSETTQSKESASSRPRAASTVETTATSKPSCLRWR
jgi:hypothetical protein